MNIKEAKEQISNAMRAYFTKNEFGEYVIPIEKQRPVFLMGPPGIGKTAVMEQIASEMLKGSGRKLSELRPVSEETEKELENLQFAYRKALVTGTTTYDKDIAAIDKAEGELNLHTSALEAEQESVSRDVLPRMPRVSLLPSPLLDRIVPKKT